MKIGVKTYCEEGFIVDNCCSSILVNLELKKFRFKRFKLKKLDFKKVLISKNN